MAYRCLVLAGPWTTYNLAATATITVTSENANFPKAMLVDGRMANPFRYSADASNVDIILDFGSSKAVDFVGIFGHNLTSGITEVQVQWSDTGTGGPWTTMMSCDHEQPAFYVYRGTGSVSKRYWRIRFLGTNGSAIWIGELVIGAASVLAKNPNYPVSVTPMEAHIEHALPNGDLQVTSIATAPPRRLDMGFQGSVSDEKDAFDKVYTPSRGSLYSAVFVPQAADSYDGSAKQVLLSDQRVVMLARLDKTWPRIQHGLNVMTWQIGATEQGYPGPMA